MSSVQSLHNIALYILHHHERWDGKGYPDGLTKEEIPRISQILTVADVWHAMTENRPYRKARSKDDALRELQNGKGTHFSPAVAEIFINMIKRGLL